MTPTPTVQGRCPACSRSTLILGVDGYVTCSHLDCPDPAAASDLLEGERLDRAERAIAAVRRLSSRISQLDPHSHSDYLMGAKDALDRAIRTIDRTARKGHRR